MTKIAVSSIVSSFDAQTIGTKVLNAEAFWRAVTSAVQAHDFAADKVPGQAFILVPEAIPYVSGGMGRNVNDPAAYVPRSYRGKVQLYLRREHAVPVEGCAVVVYTTAAYLADPDINETPGEADQIRAENPTHVLVAILAFGGPGAVLNPYRFVKNLAGGNNEALIWTGDEIRAKAREIAAQVDEWSTVAD